VLPTKLKFELVRRIACLADNQKTTCFVQRNIAGVAGSCGSGSKFIVVSKIGAIPNRKHH
jgi:hypothetical protein